MGAGEHLVDEKGSHEDRFEFAKKSDIVVCCLTMNTETAGIINKEFVSSMRKGGLLVNIARGGLLDYEAVHNGLKSGHLGGVTECSYRSMAKVVGDVALQLHSGKPLTGIEQLEVDSRALKVTCQASN
nr:D-isomer specific 2-hydroxyacid dehydrogenase family protein [Tanacetum cinerariifolium]